MALVVKNGATIEYATALYKAGLAFRSANADLKDVIEVFKKARGVCESAVERQGFTVLQAEMASQKMGAETNEISLWYKILKELAYYDFDSYMLVLEKRRLVDERFYMPRRKCLIKTGAVKALQDLEDDVYDTLSLSLPPGIGKALAMDSKVLTPSGWVRNDSLKVGDIVIAASGKHSKVLGVYPQGKKMLYDVIFDDGSKARCSADHLWTCQSREDRKNVKYRTISLKNIMRNYKVENGKRLNYSIDYVKPIEFEEKDFIIHPYVMGVLLGNGNFSATPIVTLADAEVIDKVNELLPDRYSLKHKAKYDYCVNGHEGNNAKAGSLVTKEIKRYGLFGKKSHEKHIPKDYLFASVEQRFWLLRGLFDTDGSVSNNNPIYCTTSYQLALDVAELAHSLGGYASIHEKQTSYKDKDGNYIECKTAYNVLVQFASGYGTISTLERKQYNPKRKVIKRFIKDIVEVGEEECQCIYIDDESHLYITDDYIITHNTTLEKFFTSWIIGRHPKDYNLFFSHSDDITRMFYDGILDITTSAEYCWGEIFPNVKLRKTDASRQQIDFDKNKPFWSIQCTSRFSKNAGKVRTNRYLLCDDIIGGIEEAMNLNFLDKLWQVYAVDARQRKLNSQVKELHICTRWSVHDIVGRLKKAYDGNPRYKFVAIPDIDPVTGESNFMFEINGMSVEFFNDQRELMDEASYRALYKNEPIEREGLLFPETSLRRYLELPTEPPEEILGQCDCKAKGTDFMVMPILYRYGTDYYAVDCVCNQDSDYEYQYQSLANMIVDLQAQNVEFESNQGGDRVAMEVNKRVTEMGWICNITSKPTETNKEARIYQYSNWVKQHVIFKDKSLYSHQSDYENFMGNLLGYTVAGKNAHDDVPDCLSNLAARQMRKMAKGATVSAITNPFRSGMTVNDIWGY